MKKKRIRWMLMILGAPLLFLLISNLMIEQYASGRTYNSSSKIASNRVGLVLGTSPKLVNGRKNLFFQYRIEAAVKLFRSGKVDYLLVSGDNGSPYYDEPTAIKKALIARGIPEGKIYLDYAGFRTLDSVVRAKEIFGQSTFTVISQQFHNERAIFLARSKGIEAIGFNARDVKGRNGLKVKVREALARAKVFLDIIFQVEPKFLGEKISIP
ncbi:MAG: ElyC/SanA/YdcF family protein [Bacteroidota bacterium]